MDALNLRILVNLSGGTGARAAAEARRGGAPARRRRAWCSSPTWTTATSISRLLARGWPQRLEADVKAGARGLKIFKNFGLTLKRANGARVPVDDPEFDEVFETCARLGMPVLIHTGEPAPFFDPVDEHNERWLELQVHPERRRPPEQFPTFEALMAERDRLFAKHPHTQFIAAHMGFHANDLGRLGRMLLDRLPNVYTETGAIIAELGRQPRAARAFFAKYQDRILFGKDTSGVRVSVFWRTFETADEYFDYYRDYHAFWKLYGLDLPDGVLRKLYYGNALEVVHGLACGGVPADRGTFQLIARFVRTGSRPEPDPRVTVIQVAGGRRCRRHLRVALYVVTGGAGFIGSHLAEELERAASACGSSTASSPATARTSAHLRRVEFVEGDLADLDVARQRGGRRRLRAAPGGDSVGAAIGRRTRSRRIAPTSMRRLHVLVAARDSGVKRVVYAASSSAYGDTPTSPKREDMPTDPLSPYALQKLVGEQYMQLFTALYGLETVSDPLLQRVRSAAGPVVAVLRRHLALRDGAPRGRSPTICRRRRADARLHLRRQRRRRRAARRARRRRRPGK